MARRTRSRTIPALRASWGFRAWVGYVAVVGTLLPSVPANAHGFAGKRFFPSTLTVEDPFVTDELSLVAGHRREPVEGASGFSHVTRLSAELSKRITPRLGISIAGEWISAHPSGESARRGFSNLEVGARYQFLTSELHEAVASLDFGAEVGGSGDAGVGAEPFSVVTPGLLFGKGAGDLPDSLRFLRPFALTGAVGVALPLEGRTRTRSFDPATGSFAIDVQRNALTVEWGATLQYNIPYLQSFVKETALPAPLDHMIPVLELAMHTCLDRGCSGQTTGTLSPGVFWIGRHFQLGIEAQIPVNRRTGNQVGALAIVHIFLDDVFPSTWGRPLLAGRSRP